jgi:hypothetical protein
MQVARLIWRGCDALGARDHPALGHVRQTFVHSVYEAHSNFDMLGGGSSARGLGWSGLLSLVIGLLLLLPFVRIAGVGFAFAEGLSARKLCFGRSCGIERRGAGALVVTFLSASVARPVSIVARAVLLVLCLCPECCGVLLRRNAL